MEKDYSEVTAKRLYELRTKKGYTMEKLAKMIGVSKGTISKWEKGSIKNMRQDKVLLLAQIFNVSPTYIMGYEKVSLAVEAPNSIDKRKEGVTERVTTFIDLYSQLNPANQELVDNMIIALSKKQ